MIYDAKTREVIVINGQGPAPKAATPALFAAEGRPPSNGPLGATIPAMLDAMAIALETKGTMRLEQVMQPAIELADGFPMYEFLRHYLISRTPGDGEVRVVREDLLPGRPHSRGRRDVPSAEPGADAARHRRRRESVVRQDAQPRRRPFRPGAMRSTPARSRVASSTLTAPRAAYSPTRISRTITAGSKSRRRRRSTGTTCSSRDRGTRGRCCCRR